MVPLAVTSTNDMIKRLGGKRWRALHRLIYVAAVAGVIHYYLQAKADVRQPLGFAAVLTVLLGYRVLEYWRQRKPGPVAAANRGLRTLFGHSRDSTGNQSAKLSAESRN